MNRALDPNIFNKIMFSVSCIRTSMIDNLTPKAWEFMEKNCPVRCIAHQGPMSNAHIINCKFYLCSLIILIQIIDILLLRAKKQATQKLHKWYQACNFLLEFVFITVANNHASARKQMSWLGILTEDGHEQRIEG